MGTYTDFEWREMEACEFDQDDRRRPSAVPTQSFDSWLDDAFEERACDIGAAHRLTPFTAAELVDAGMSLDAAMEAAYLKLEDGP
jgi:hypothetical protein